MDIQHNIIWFNVINKIDTFCAIIEVKFNLSFEARKSFQMTNDTFISFFFTTTAFSMKMITTL